ncbi:MAG: DUF5606 domain-containing protein [Sphingobacteriales bacterium]|nr:DUF5606 domain-containing protein [Sphingobacteriales bacterium]OJW01608.1 MAG: hypothetical protein BGO52_14070 [Sphingobacteriales bacterium 44-61]
MEYSKLVAVTGLPGLYELINSKNDGAIVRSLDDNSTKFASSRIHNFSHLESIEVYTVGDNVNLVEIFHAMDKAGGTLPDGKDNGALKKYFEKAYPELDFERVYASDLKKMVKWFEILKKKNIEIKLSEPPAEEETPVVEEVKKVAEEKAPKKKAAAKKEEKEEAPKKKEAKKETAAEEPVKEKAAAKKKAAPKKEDKAEKEEAPKKKAAAKKK